MKRVDRKNLGLSFCHCHFLAQEDHRKVETAIRDLGDDLKMVLIPGADELDTPKRDRKRLIQPLNKGNFDLTRGVRVPDEMNYKGPVCLQSS